jgi:formimidoylglutamate deiminase
MVPTIRGNYAVVPGLVNAHSHAFQRVIRGRTEQRTPATRDSFWTWREAMYGAANRLTPDDIYAVARMAYLEMVLAGITTVGEFHYLHRAPDGSRYDDANLMAHQLIRAANDVGIRIVLLHTAYERAGWQKEPNPLQARFTFGSVDGFMQDVDALLASGARVGLALHSVRALRLRSVLELAEFGRRKQLPIHMHVAEQPAEIEECVAEHGRRPVELLSEQGVLGSDFTAVHGIHIGEEEAAFLGAARCTVCACPTTERNLGDGAVPADRLLQVGAAICFGSDSNAQIDLFEDAHCLEYHLRMKKLSRAVLAPDALYEAATGGGARSLGGSADSGDYFTVDLDHPSVAGWQGSDLTAQLIFSTQRAAVRDVFVCGRQVVAEGRHANQGEIVSAFSALQRRLWG